MGILNKFLLLFCVTIISFSCSKRDASQIPSDFTYNGKYYHWDAKEDYWYGNYENQTFDEDDFKEKYTAYGETFDGDLRLPNYIVPNDKFNRQASFSCKECPSFNEVTWYFSAGIYYDKDQEWAIQDKVFKGGFWLKRKEYIKNYSDTIPCHSVYNSIHSSSEWMIKTNKGKPTEISKYFFIPATGEYCIGRINGIGESGEYWTSTPSSKTSAWMVSFSDVACNFWKCGELKHAYRIWKAE